METLITYIIKVSISIALFYGLHMLLLRNETFLKMRRAYFLLALAFSLLYPFINFNWTVSTPEELPLPAYILSEIVVLADSQQELWTVDDGVQSFVGSTVLTGILVIGVVVLLARFVIQLLSLLFHLRKWKVRGMNGCKLLEVDDACISSFSFFGWIVVNKRGATESQIDDIIQHEKAHAEQLHSIDVLVYELFCILLWWNPFVWLLKKEMKLNLEYLADGAIRKNRDDLRGYQYTLLQISTANTGVAFINNFNVSQLKKRITMMNKKRTSAMWSGKFLLVLPLAMALVLGNVQCSSDAEKADKIESVDLESIEAVDIISMTINKQSGLLVIETKTATYQFKESAAKGTKYERLFAPDEVKTEKPEAKKSEVFTIVENMPAFPGGETAMMKYIGANIKYPEIAQKQGIEGRVVVRFTVLADGKITDAEVMRGISPECDAEALRVVRAMPTWTPGKQNGQNVAVYFTLPILFRLQ